MRVRQLTAYELAVLGALHTLGRPAYAHEIADLIESPPNVVGSACYRLKSNYYPPRVRRHQGHPPRWEAIAREETG